MSEFVELGDICDFVRGVTFAGSDTVPTPQVGTLPILRAGNIGEELKIREDLIWIPAKKVSPQQRMKVGDIAICMSSGSSSVVGKTAQLKEPFEGSIGAFCGIVRPKTESLQNYLPFWFRSSSFVNWRDVQAKGANIQNLRFSELASLPIPLPTPTEQQRIAATLGRADHLRRTRHFARQMSDTFLQSVFLNMFGDPISNPMKWDVVEASEIYHIQLGKMLDAKKFTGSHLRPYLGNSNVQWGKLELDDLKQMDFSSDFEKFKLKKGDILVCEGGEVGRAAIWNDEVKDCCYECAPVEWTRRKGPNSNREQL